MEEAFDTNWVAPLGPNVNAFEKEMEEYTGCGYAAALSAGTAAIHLALRMIGIQPGDVVFSSDLTFSATCNGICCGILKLYLPGENDRHLWGLRHFFI